MNKLKAKQIDMQDMDESRAKNPNVDYLLGNTSTEPCQVALPASQEGDKVHLQKTALGWKLMQNMYGEYQLPIMGRWKLTKNKACGFSKRGPYDRDHNNFASAGINNNLTDYRMTGFTFPGVARMRYFHMNLRKYYASGKMQLQVRFNATKFTGTGTKKETRRLYTSPWVYMNTNRRQYELDSVLDFEVEEDEMLSVEIFRNGSGDTSSTTEYAVVTGSFGYDLFD